MSISFFIVKILPENFAGRSLITVNFVTDRNTSIFECLDLTLDFLIDHFPLQMRGSYRMIGLTLQQVIDR